MRHFVKIAVGIDTTALCLALARQPGLWNVHPWRTGSPTSPHREADDILLRFNPLPDNTCQDARECMDYPAFACLPQARPLVFGLMAQIEGERLGRVMVTRLAPGGRIYPHSDIGEQRYDTMLYYGRYHIVLADGGHDMFQAGDDVVQMHTGECWWFDNAQQHECLNSGDGDRLHLIIDIHAIGNPR